MNFSAHIAGWMFMLVCFAGIAVYWMDKYGGR